MRPHRRFRAFGIAGGDGIDNRGMFFHPPTVMLMLAQGQKPHRCERSLQIAQDIAQNQVAGGGGDGAVEAPVQSHQRIGIARLRRDAAARHRIRQRFDDGRIRPLRASRAQKPSLSSAQPHVAHLVAGDGAHHDALARPAPPPGHHASAVERLAHRRAPEAQDEDNRRLAQRLTGPELPVMIRCLMIS